MVFPELGLQQKISGVGIIAEDPLHGTLVKHAAALGGISAFVQPFGDGGDTLSSQVVIEDACIMFSPFVFCVPTGLYRA